MGKRTFKKLRKCGAKQDDTLSHFMDSLSLNCNHLNLECVCDTKKNTADYNTENKQITGNCKNVTTDVSNEVYEQEKEDTKCNTAENRVEDKIMFAHNDSFSCNSTNSPSFVR